jgi:transcription termination factor Rho
MAEVSDGNQAEAPKKRRGRPRKKSAVDGEGAVAGEGVDAGKAASPSAAAAESPSGSAARPAPPPNRPTRAEVAAASTIVWSPPDLPPRAVSGAAQDKDASSSKKDASSPKADSPVNPKGQQEGGQQSDQGNVQQPSNPQQNGSQQGNLQQPAQPNGSQPGQGNQPIQQQNGQQQGSRNGWNNGQQQGNQVRGKWKNGKWHRNNGGNWNNNRPQNQPMPPVPRDPNLPEYKLSDIHSWDNATIVAKMMADANPEDLGAMKRHEIIFAAIRSYLSRGGAVMASGCLEVVREGFGYLRSAKTNFLACPEDVFVPQQQIRRHMLRPGDMVEGPLRDPRDKDKLFGLGGVLTVNGKTPSEAARIVHFENLVPTFPTRRIVLETTAAEYSTRVVDIFTPIGFGQRGIIVAPPRVGKTVLLQKIANAITANHPEAMLIVLLIDERPEEVTDMQRNTKAMVLSSTFDEEPQHHVNVAEMVIEMSRRQVENGRDVVILLDSITRLARAYNTVQPHSGKILTGGVDALALHRPKRFFGAARNIEGGGSLTILATALIDTGSRMDEVIFEEFKGTGNMELVLDRGLADKRIFPAIDIEKSGTRKEDLLLAPLELEKTWGLRRVLADAGPERAMLSVLGGMKKFKSNPEFLLSLDLKNI